MKTIKADNIKISDLTHVEVSSSFRDEASVHQLSKIFLSDATIKVSKNGVMTITGSRHIVRYSARKTFIEDMPVKEINSEDIFLGEKTFMDKVTRQKREYVDGVYRLKAREPFKLVMTNWTLQM